MWVRDKWRKNLVTWYKFTFAICRKSDSKSREGTWSLTSPCSWPRLFKLWIALSTGIINIQWITITETNCTIHWIEIWGQMCNDEGDKVKCFTSPPNDSTIWIACVKEGGRGKGERLKKGKWAPALKSRFFSNAHFLSLAKAPAGYSQKLITGWNE